MIRRSQRASERAGERSAEIGLASQLKSVLLALADAGARRTLLHTGEGRRELSGAEQRASERAGSGVCGWARLLCWLATGWLM